MKKGKALLKVLTVFILVGTFFTAGLFPGDQDETSSETEQSPDNGVVKEQSAGSEKGTTKRHLDMSDPFTGAYLHEDMKIVGKAEVKESFTMGNIDAGSNVESGIGEEGGTKDASVGVEDKESGEAVVEPEQENSNGSNPAIEKENNPEAAEELGYLLNPASPLNWAELF